MKDACEESPATRPSTPPLYVSSNRTRYWGIQTDVVWDNGIIVEREFMPHRVNGPAVIQANGRQEWYFEGRLHRENGPAVTHTDGIQEYWLHGNQLPTHPG